MENRDKLNRLFDLRPAGIILQSSWLKQQGYSHDLQQRYKKSKWLLPIGAGAYIRAGDKASVEGAIYALQQQSNLSIHPGARTAFYLEPSVKELVLFGSPKEKLPAWFSKHDWGVKIDYHPTSFLDPHPGMINREVSGLNLAVSGPARALMECIYLAPHHQDLMGCYESMEGLNDLQPEEVEALLENCRSVKVKRLFAYMADKACHEWFEEIYGTNIELGNGKRNIVRNGIYVNEYRITVPKELGRLVE